MNLVWRDRGLVDYQQAWEDMQRFTDNRTPQSADEFWLVEHPPVYTLGKGADEKHILARNQIPVIRSDRGGQITYHGPGQLLVYTLIDVRRIAIGPKELVNRIEQGVIDFLQKHSITGVRRPGAPGVYVNDRKIAALGLRIRKGRSFHGLALNVNADLRPFADINPCGYAGLETVNLSELSPGAVVAEVQQSLVAALATAIYAENPVRPEVRDWADNDHETYFPRKTHVG